MKVAVVDTGFDEAGNGTRITTFSRSFALARVEAADPNADRNGHGTAVAGLILGKDGVGLAPGAALAVYKVTKGEHGSYGPEWKENPNGNGSTMTITPKDMERWYQDLPKAVLQACREGNEVINLSWGGHADESAERPYEGEMKKLMEELARRGCLAIVAAGNDAQRVPKRRKMSENDSWLRVEAFRPLSNDMALFSSSGEVSAPGVGVLSLITGAMKGHSAACGKDPDHGFLNGTSFAAPLVTGAATQAVAVLKHFGKWKALKGPERVRLLNSILRASAADGQVNAFLAVKAAEAWSKKLAPKVSSAAAIRSAVYSENSKDCQKKWEPCLDIDVCEARRQCFDRNRRSVLLCALPDKSKVDDLVETALSSGYLEMATRWLGKGSTDYASLMWDAYEREPNKGSLSRALQLYQLLAKDLGPDRRNEVRREIEKRFFEIVKIKNFLRDGKLTEDARKLASSLVEEKFVSGDLAWRIYGNDQSTEKNFSDAMLREWLNSDAPQAEIDWVVQRVIDAHPPERITLTLMHSKRANSPELLRKLAGLPLSREAFEAAMYKLLSAELNSHERDELLILFEARPDFKMRDRSMIYNRIADGSFPVPHAKARLMQYIEERPGYEYFEPEDFLRGSWPFMEPSEALSLVDDEAVKALIQHPNFNHNSASKLAMTLADARAPLKDRTALVREFVAMVRKFPDEDQFRLINSFASTMQCSKPDNPKQWKNALPLKTQGEMLRMVIGVNKQTKSSLEFVLKDCR